MTETLQNPWLSASAISLIENEMIIKTMRDKWKSSSLLLNTIGRNGESIISIRVIPEDGPLRFFMEGGPVVYIYIKGLSFFGGEGDILTKDFWQMLRDCLFYVPKLWRPSYLSAIPATRVLTGKKLKKSTEDPFPQMIPASNVIIKDIELKVTAMDKETGASVTFHRPCYHIWDNDIMKDAQIKLSMIVNEWDKTVIDD